MFDGYFFINILNSFLFCFLFRTAEKINAGLIVVLAQTGRTVSLVAKYRPPMPVLSVVIPTLQASKGLSWKLEGKLLARQCLTMRGVKPIMAAPMGSSGEELLSATVRVAHCDGLIKPMDYVVAILSQNDSLVVKVVQANSKGDGIAKAFSSDVKVGGKSLDHQSCLGSPTHLLSRASMSLAGAGTFGANIVENGFVSSSK